MKSEIPELLADFKQGKMVVLLDDEDRENEGDLIIAANKITADDINFMATYGRGLICLTLTKQRCEQLNLPLMVKKNTDSHNTNFTISIEAARGVTTGISTTDRAKTIQAAVATDASSEDIISPGHIFPLMARNGGVLTRSGHTEAGCDLAKLCGFEPAAVIVEILNQDGTMARLDDIEVFASKHNIKWGTIADLISYRLNTEKSITQINQDRFDSPYGILQTITYRDNINNLEHIVLISGQVEPITNVRVTMQHNARDVLNKDLSVDIIKVLEYIYNNNGVLLLLSKEGSYKDDNKTFGIGAQILADIGINKMNLISKQNAYKKNAFKGFGLIINKYINLEEE